MHRCSNTFHHGLYRSVPCLPPYQPALSSAHSCCSYVDYPEILPDVHCCSPTYHYDSSCYDCLPRVHHHHHSRPPIVQTNIQNDFCYYLDEPEQIYDDAHGHPYRLSRTKVQLVDIVPKHRQNRNGNSMVVSTYQQPKERQQSERVIVPRSTVVRHTSVPSYDRPRRRKLVPLYHSAEPQYLVSRRQTSPVRELIPVATYAPTNSKTSQTIRVRSMSPID